MNFAYGVLLKMDQVCVLFYNHIVWEGELHASRQKWHIWISVFFELYWLVKKLYTFVTAVSMQSFQTKCISHTFLVDIQEQQEIESRVK